MSNLEDSVILGAAQEQLNLENGTQRATKIVLHILGKSNTPLPGEKIWKEFQQQTTKNPASF